MILRSIARIVCEHCQRRALSSGRSFIQPAGPYSIYGHLLQQPCKNDSSKRALHCWWPVLLKAAGARASAKPLVKEELETEDSNELRTTTEQKQELLVPNVRIEDEEVLKECYPRRTLSSSSSSSPTPPSAAAIKEQELEEDWREERVSLRRLPWVYLRLSKHRLTMLVVLTALGGYTMAPAPFHLDTLLWTVVGTGLCSAGANTINQWIEIPFDSQMARTMNRVLVRGIVSPLHALIFGLTSGAVGTVVLATLVNPLTAALGAANIFLYTSVYTPLKRLSIINTWVGSVVGSIPPLMGWAACSGTLHPGSLVLAGLLYSWQFPHFNALSWRLRGDYSRGGYRMMAVTNPSLCRRVALRYSLVATPLCLLAPACELTTWWFALDTLPLNGWLGYLGWRFYSEGDFKSARKLFRFTLFYLPFLFGLLIINKRTWS